MQRRPDDRHVDDVDRSDDRPLRATGVACRAALLACARGRLRHEWFSRRHTRPQPPLLDPLDPQDMYTRIEDILFSSFQL